MKKIVGYALLAIVAVILVGYLLMLRSDIPAAELEAKYADGASQFLELATGERFHVRDEGDPFGPPVVLVHGSNASLHTWEPWVERLGDSYRIVSLDLPGHGLTGPTPSGDYSIEGMAAAVDHIVDALGLDRFVLVGSSMGGFTAWVYALEHPERVEALILVGAAGLPESDEEAEGDPLVFRLMRTSLGRTLMAPLSPEGMIENGLRGSFVDQSKVTQDMIDRYVELNLREGNRGATMERFAIARPMHLAARLGDLTMPTLVLHGDKDALVPIAHGRAFAERIPNATLVVYENVGHIPMEEVPDRSAADVRAFLSALPAPQADSLGGER